MLETIKKEVEDKEEELEKLTVSICPQRDAMDKKEEEIEKIKWIKQALEIKKKSN